jgi:DNA repair protein RecN (Recombination protein N)
VRVAFEGVREATAALGALREHETDRAERMERLEGVVAELSSLAPRAGELAELERERRVLRNAGRMAELLDAVVALSYEGDSAAASLSAAAAARAEELAELDPALAELAERLRAASIELEDAGQGFRDYRERTDFDPARLEALESRRAAVEHACLRHGSDEAGLVALRERAEEELRSLGTLGAAVRTAEEALGAAEKRYAAAASVLTRVRRRAAAALERAVCEQLAELALSKARFRVELPAARGAPLGRGAADCPLTPSGAERVEFLLAANPGEPLRPLRRTASGGELARVMLALHVAARDRANGRIVVFDEVDAGVSGAVADAVGSRLQRLSRSNQLLCVTHLPQVAAYADRHFRVRKRVRRGRTHAGIADLSGSERVEELARMLGGRGPTPTSRRHASELLQAAGRVRRGRVRSEA